MPTKFLTFNQVIDLDGYRHNVGIILANREGMVLWARRIGQDAWQFPQGGIREYETTEQAMFRELAEEIGLQPGDVMVRGCTRGWLRYRLPRRYIRHNSEPVCVGQKQVWFLLSLIGSDSKVCLNLSERPEFDRWRWVDYWRPLQEVVSFKRGVYECALRELAPLVIASSSRHPPLAEQRRARRVASP
ncbi:RNA pyrophosphohydrolase [Gammaproteobacteria bacterium]